MSPHSSAARKKAAAAPTVALPWWIAEFALIRTAVLITVACVLACLFGVVLTEWRQQDAQQRQRQVQRTRDAAYSRYAHVDNEKRDIRDFQARYIELRARGLVGEENRLNWVDAVRQVQEDRKLLPLTYEIDPQQPVRLESALDLGDYQLRGSRMHVHMQLLHELDLFNFLEDLHQRSYFAVQDCSVKRLATAAGSPGGPTLGADCTLNWITLAPVPLATPVASVPTAKGKS